MWLKTETTPTRPNKTMELEAKSMENSNMFHISASSEIGPKAKIALLAAISPGRTFPLPEHCSPGLFDTRVPMNRPVCV